MWPYRWAACAHAQSTVGSTVGSWLRESFLSEIIIFIFHRFVKVFSLESFPLYGNNFMRAKALVQLRRSIGAEFGEASEVTSAKLRSEFGEASAKLRSEFGEASEMISAKRGSMVAESVTFSCTGPPPDSDSGSEIRLQARVQLRNMTAVLIPAPKSEHGYIPGSVVRQRFRFRFWLRLRLRLRNKNTDPVPN